MKTGFHMNNLKIQRTTVSESKLIDKYYALYPNIHSYKEHGVIFGTSGHRGNSEKYNFNEAHILAISQSIVYIRKYYGITGPCYVGRDTHILSEPAFLSVLEVLTANCVDVVIQQDNEYLPTPVISNAIVNYNIKNKHQRHHYAKADGIIITASHNPPCDGGIKYSSIFGGPASITITRAIEHNANKLLINNLKGVRRLTINGAWNSGYIHVKNLIQNYVTKLTQIINMEAIKIAGLKLGIDPLSGSSISCWNYIDQYYQLDLTIINDKIDKTFSFIDPDPNGCIQIDCVSVHNLTRIIPLFKKFDLIFINDPDCDRHGIITNHGLMESSDYFPIVINYLFKNRPLWKDQGLLIGKTNVSSTMINKVVYKLLNRQLLEVPVGFKWFSKGLFNSYLGFAGEDSAGASFLNYNCSPWSTDKDGLIMCLLAAETLAVTNQTLQQHHKQLLKNCGVTNYNSIQIVINHIQKSFIINTLFHQIQIFELAGDPIIETTNIIPWSKKLSMAGIKIITRNGWIACRLSGTEMLYKIYCESFLDVYHLKIMESEIIQQIYKIIN